MRFHPKQASSGSLVGLRPGPIDRCAREAAPAKIEGGSRSASLELPPLIGQVHIACDARKEVRA